MRRLTDKELADSRERAERYAIAYILILAGILIGTLVV